MNALCNRIVSAAECVSNEILVSACEKLNIILMRVMPLRVPIFRSTEHIRNFLRSSFRKCIDFSSTVMLENI